MGPNRRKRGKCCLLRGVQYAEDTGTGQSLGRVSQKARLKFLCFANVFVYLENNKEQLYRQGVWTR